jgi:hypothetical protein
MINPMRMRWAKHVACVGMGGGGGGEEGEEEEEEEECL